MSNIIIENKRLKLILSEDCKAISLIHKQSGLECLETDKALPLFTLTEERPFDNNIKLAHPNKRMTFSANRVTREGDRLICGFEMINSRAAVALKITDDYIGFELAEIIAGDAHGLCMDFPPVCEFRFVQLPIKQRENFGEWLNVMWDSEVAVNLLATCPLAKIDAAVKNGYSVMTADAVRGIKLEGCSAALIVSKPDELLDIIERVETDFGLPQGVRSRRGENINRSCYWTSHINPSNVDKHIAYAKRAGLKLMLIYYPAIFRRGNCYDATGSYEYSDNYPNGFDDLKAMIKKLNDAGITAGLHILHTHIGFATKYVTPVADHRLRLKDHFTLARPLGETDDTVYVEESTEVAPRHESCKILRFGGEIIKYTSVSAEPPYVFLGCTRGHLGTAATAHEAGQIGGVLDVSEFCATSCYIDQNTSLQDEIADEIARVYSAGFEFIYYDGSEGTNPPFEIYIPYAQYRVYKKLDRAPLFCEGAAKSHFSWHILSGGNAFDAFGTKFFKECTDLHPLAEAVRMKKDFTRINFGWWAFRVDTQPDVIEYGTSHAAAYDCPGTMMENTALFEKNARTDDILEVLRRWEYVREHGSLTDEQKRLIGRPGHEYTMLINEQGEYEPVECFEVRNDDAVSAFLFEKDGSFYVSLWHKTDEAKLRLNVSAEDVVYFDDFGKEPIRLEKSPGGAVLPLGGKRYAKIARPKDEIVKIIQEAIVM